MRFSTVAFLVKSLFLISALHQYGIAAAPAENNTVLIPRPSGPFNVSLTHHEVIDPERTDPYSEDVRDRRFMISLFFPVAPKNCTEYCTKPYMPPRTAEVTSKQFFFKEDTGVFNAQFQLCCGSNQTVPSNFTVVILEPELGTSRHLYGAAAQHIAGNGYAVITIDHAFDSCIVEYTNDDETTVFDTVYQNITLNPFGRLEEFNKTVADAIRTRIQDIDYLYRQLNDPRFVKQLLPGSSMDAHFITNQTAIIGHGIGGTTSTYLATDEKRAYLSLNWDGTPSLVESDVYNKSIHFFGRDPDHTRDDDINWPRIWPYLKGWSTEFDMKNAMHFDYSDLPLLAKLSGKAKERLRGLGMIDDLRAWNITTQFSVAFLDSEYWNGKGKGKGRKVLQGVMALYPEMKPWGLS